jgi:hypothetical protein
LHKIDKEKTHPYVNSRLDLKTREHINEETKKLNSFLHKPSIREYSTKANNTYKLNSPTYEILCNTFISEPANDLTQKKLETFLLKSFLEKTSQKEAKLEKLDINYRLYSIPVVKEALKEEDNLHKLIKNYKLLAKNKKDLLSIIISKTSDKFVISG